MWQGRSASLRALHCRHAACACSSAVATGASPRSALHHGPQVVQGVHVDQQVADPAVQEGGGEQPPPLPHLDEGIGLQREKGQ